MKNNLLPLSALVLIGLFFLSGCIVAVDSEDEAAELPVEGARPMTDKEVDDFITALNRYRSSGASCGTQGVFGAQESLVWNQKLAEAAQAHSDDQYQMNQMSHTGSDGSKPSDRLNRVGYSWMSVRENVASGYFRDVDHLAEAWMKSDGHCANMMASNVTELGIAATRQNNGNGFWTLKLAHPRQ